MAGQHHGSRAKVPSWDEIMRRQRATSAGGHEHPIGLEDVPSGSRPDGGLPRLTLGSVVFDQAGGRARVRIELVHGENRVEASAARSTPARAAAEATARAVDELVGTAASLEVDSVGTQGARVVVELTVSTRAGSQHLVGAVTADDHDWGMAAIRATFDAVNRPLGRWLAISRRAEMRPHDGGSPAAGSSR